MEVAVEATAAASSATFQISPYRHRTSRMLRQPITGVPARVEVSQLFFLINAAINRQLFGRAGCYITCKLACKYIIDAT